MPNTICDLSKVNIGQGTYGNLNIIMYGNSDERLEIGNYCSIAGKVFFLLGGEHSYKRFSQYPFIKLTYNEKIDAVCKGPIIVEDDVWIGFGSIILSGVRLGKGCIVGAGSVVTKDIPPYAIFAGGKIIKYRFPKEIIEKLQEINMNTWGNKEWDKFRNDCLMELTDENINDFCRRYR